MPPGVKHVGPHPLHPRQCGMRETPARRGRRRAAGANSEGLGNTGMLLYSTGSFFRVREGFAGHVDGLFEQIGHDKRKQQRTPVIREPIPNRYFGSWSMAASRQCRNMQTFAGLFPARASRTSIKAAQRCCCWRSVRVAGAAGLASRGMQMHLDRTWRCGCATRERVIGVGGTVTDRTAVQASSVSNRAPMLRTTVLPLAPTQRLLQAIVLQNVERGEVGEVGDRFLPIRQSRTRRCA